MTYEDIKRSIENLPMTWIPAILIILVKTAIKQKCFKDNKIHIFVKSVEAKEMSKKC